MADTPSAAGRYKWVFDLIYRGDLARRFTQDSPVLPDVWVAYADPTEQPVDLLLTPFQDIKTGGTGAGDLCRALVERLEAEDETDYHKALGREPVDREIAYNQSSVAVRLWFDELVRVVLPMSRWWHDRVCLDDKKAEIFDALGSLSKGQGVDELVEALYDPDMLRRTSTARAARRPNILPEALWMVRVIGTIALVNRDPNKADTLQKIPRKDEEPNKRREVYRRIVEAAGELLKDIRVDQPCSAYIYSVSRNREASSTVYRSGVAVKADAVARLFHIDCSQLTWAVIDSGIDAEHYAFRQRHEVPVVAKKAKAARKDGKAKAVDDAKPAVNEVYYEYAFEMDEQGRVVNRTRVVATYDFTMIRQLLKITPKDQPRSGLPDSLRRRLDPKPKESDEEKKRRLRLEQNLLALKEGLRLGREIDWELVKTLIEVPHRPGEYRKPHLDHGTHVTGILAADWRQDGGAPREEGIRGICPDLKLYDLRVFAEEADAKSAEFSIISALQFVRSLNAHKKFMVVHGVNLSLSIRHVVENYACGQTPICEECERLVNNGLVVVAAAGNNGYLRRGPEDSFDDRYQSMTITDPGNAEAVITVGATHRDMPHSYGVSYFSSRGPTGDGRPKPDLVAPGEKIEAPIPNDRITSMDGTSMAAPHVSGAAALLIARNGELIGRPSRIKQILCNTATDLGRDRYFQGSGMLDILRALQSV